MRKEGENDLAVGYYVHYEETYICLVERTLFSKLHDALIHVAIKSPQTGVEEEVRKVKSIHKSNRISTNISEKIEHSGF